MPATRSAIFADRRALHTFIESLKETDWNPDVIPFGPCRRGARLVELGWLKLHRPASRGYAGFMGGSYHPASYTVTTAGFAVEDVAAAVSATLGT